MSSRWFTAGVISVAAAVAIALALSATGVPVDHVSANNGGVWLTSDLQGGAGFAEFDAPASQLGSHDGVPGQSFGSAGHIDVLQSGTSVIAIDHQGGQIYPINEQTGSIDAKSGVPLPSATEVSSLVNGGGQIALGGGVAALWRPGAGGAPSRLWAASIGSAGQVALAGLAQTVKPLAVLAGGYAVSVDSSGDVYFASPTRLVEIPNGPSGFMPATSLGLPNLTGVQLTTVGTTPVAVDPGSGQLYLPDASTSVDVPGGSAVLQQPGPAAAQVYVATPGGLYSVPLSGGSAQLAASVRSSGSDRPGQPVVTGACALGAWSGSPGQVVTVCSGAQSHVQRLPGDSLTRPVFRANNGFVVLNDLSDGAAWLIRGTPDQVVRQNDWSTLFKGDQSGSQDPTQTGSPPAKQDKPKLTNPPMSARPGVESVLHILDYDTDPNNSPLAIASVTPSTFPVGTNVAITPDQQSVVLTVPPATTGTLSFQYAVVDGVGQTASGTVTVNIVGATTESPPQPSLVKDDPVHVVAGSTQTFGVLGGWRDPESDPLTVTSASVPSGSGQVSWTSDGSITFTAPPTTSDQPVTLTYDVTDGRSAPVSHTVAVIVRGTGDTTADPATANDDVVRIVAGKETTISPLTNDQFGADPSTPAATLQIAGAVSPSTPTSDLQVSTDQTEGKIVVTASPQAAGRSYLLPYQDAFGSAPLSNIANILVVVTAPPSALPPPPVTVPISVVTHGAEPVTTDVLASDSDPAGGLLTVTDATSSDGAEVAIEKGQYLRIRVTDASKWSSKAPLVVNYDVSDGVGSTQGQVFVTPEGPIQDVAPVVPVTYATVRAGNVVEVPVLSSASDPAGLPITLVQGSLGSSASSPGPVTLTVTSQTGHSGSDPGSASLTSSYLRYAAPSPSGVATAEQVQALYQVAASDGSSTTGTTVLTVLPDSTPPSTPQPSEVDARVSSGGTVVIPVPTTGVDPDGQDVTVTGIVGTPLLGRVAQVTANSIKYQAYPSLTAGGGSVGGTDQFGYQVMSPTGQVATGIVRVGVTPPSAVQGPVAVDHYAVGAPGGEVTVDLLAGAIIAPREAGQVTIEPFAPGTLPRGSVLSGSLLSVPVPSGVVPVRIAYAITDGIDPSTAQVTVRSESSYAGSPRAADFFPHLLSPKAKAISVNVLGRAVLPDGVPGGLSVSSSAKSVKVSGGTVTVPVGAYPRAFPYTLETKKTHEQSVGVIHVPGRTETLQLIPGKVITVPVNGSTQVNLKDYVTSSTGTLRITDVLQVQATPSAGLSEKVVGNTEVQVTGQGNYQGPGSLLVQITDAAGPSGNQATLAIPVMVGAPTAIVRCPQTPVQIVQGGKPVDAAVATLCQVYVPDGVALDSVRFTPTWKAQPAGVSASAAGGDVIRITAASSAQAGQSGVLHIAVNGGGQGSGDDLAVHVVDPGPATVAPYQVQAKTGTPVTVDMATLVGSPLAQPTVSVLGVSGPPSTVATTSHQGSQVTITPQTGSSGTETFNVNVSDDGRPDRQVTGVITLQVLDRPSVPSGLEGTPGDRQVVLLWGASQPNGSTVSAYNVFENGQQIASTASTTYTVTGLVNGTTYSFTVDAVNGVNVSNQSAAWQGAPKAVPGAPLPPTVTGSDRLVRVSWQQPDTNGQLIDQYQVSISPASAGGGSQTVVGTTATFKVDNNSGPYQVWVKAHNSVGWGPASPPSTAIPRPHGTPTAPSSVTATATVSNDQTNTNVVVTWPVVNPCNDAQACNKYDVTESRNGSVVSAVQVTPAQCEVSSCALSFGPLVNDSAKYSYSVVAVNAERDQSQSSRSNVVQAVGFPDAPTIQSWNDLNAGANITFAFPASNGSAITNIECLSNGVLVQTWPISGSTGTVVTQECVLPANSADSITLVAENDAGLFGPPSKAVVVHPYSTPQAPIVTATNNGSSVTFNWSGGGGSRPILSYNYGGSASGSTPGPGSVTLGSRCGQSFTVSVYVIDDKGQLSGSNSQTASTSSCPPPPPATVSISWGIPKPGTNSHYLNVSVSHFPANSAITFTCSDSGVAFFSNSTWHSTDGNGNASWAPSSSPATSCFDAYGLNTSVTVSAGNVTAVSNTIN